MIKNKAHSTRLVDVALISAMKSGSTYLSEICSEHPEIFLSRMKFIDSTISLNLEKYKNEKLVAVRKNMRPVALDAELYYSHNSNMKFVNFSV